MHTTTKSIIILAMIISTGFSFISCENKNPPESSSGEEPLSNAQAVSQAIEEPTLAQMVEYQHRIKARLERLDKQIEQLKTQTEESDIEVNSQMKKAIEELDWKNEYAHRKLDELQSANQVAWNDIKLDMDSTIHDLEMSYKEALSELNGDRAALPRPGNDK